MNMFHIVLARLLSETRSYRIEVEYPSTPPCIHRHYLMVARVSKEKKYMYLEVAYRTSFSYLSKCQIAFTNNTQYLPTLRGILAAVLTNEPTGSTFIKDLCTAERVTGTSSAQKAPCIILWPV